MERLKLVHCAKSPERLKVIRKSLECPWLFLLFSSYSDSPPKKAKLAPLQERKMIDKFKLYAKGGNGGSGCSSFRRSQRDRRGRPDGGNGGRGGDVILECSPTVWDFKGLQHHAIASRGGHGSSKNMIGTRGDDKVIHVPIGTVIHLMKGEIPSVAEVPPSKELDPWEIPGKLIDDVVESSQLPDYSSNIAESVNFSPSCSERIAEELASAKQAATVASSQVFPSDSRTNEETDDEQEMQLNVAELTKQGQRIVVAHGGEGGLGNVLNSKVPKKPILLKSQFDEDTGIEIQASDDDQSSSLSAGSPGSEAILVLELKSIADVGLVGLPNAGKSTLLGAISRAKPSVGHYAFTTLRPNLGNLNYDDLSITIADIPGLIRGAHENRGLGHAFLRHIERTKVLAYVVDLASGLDGRKGIPPWEQLRDLVLELEHHQEGLSGRPSLIVANKIDEDGTDRVYEELKSRVEGVPIFPVCAVLEEGIQELKDGLKKLVNGEVSSGLNIDNIMV